MILIPVYLVFGVYDPPVIIAIALLIISGIAISKEDRVVANQLMTYVFWLLLVGVIVLTFRHFRSHTLQNDV